MFAATAVHEIARGQGEAVWLSELSLLSKMGGDATYGHHLEDTFLALREHGQLCVSDYAVLNGCVDPGVAANGVSWRKVRIKPTSRATGNIEKQVAAGRPVLLGLLQMVSLSMPDVSGVVRITDGDKAEGNLGEPVGHAVAVVGKTLIAGVLHFLVRNSWGEGWAREGYGLIDHRYVARYGRDAAVVESVID
ncbi:C1 family peptidase [Mycobacteroides immunogenum]|uniref:Peptidase C1A papain C-terminal domain-containing protein n=1 Tax=Mycobacteroides immunogenum TaxID=83262 RepID=A0ABR5LMC1_9MYCO|nr:C1 family peptidase [Mycobacteroides immunogenum]MBF9315212.1 hypothetical protein [Mycobacteroides chelonae]KPG28240.1 hypothetical protein AN912_22055 [Mycobacteroides immunogenum]KPG28847.1 hypothetical protein AN913_13320 [Mycobacteroides immunogenum]KPG60406.1 hypothetical protein AN918_12300 [Mycobacteroides immunogenum]OHT73807.1 hypothetical protein BKG66_06055 [Mycobacteroides chelonae]